jgi:hypothetical protein
MSTFEERGREAQRPVDEAGGGESEDQHAAAKILADAPEESDDSRAAQAGEADSVVPEDE